VQFVRSSKDLAFRVTAAFALVASMAITYLLVASGSLPAIGGASGLSAGMADLVANLGISAYAAQKAIDIIVTFSDIALILSLLASVFGAGIFTAGLVAVAKRLALRYGKEYAVAW